MLTIGPWKTKFGGQLSPCRQQHLLFVKGGPGFGNQVATKSAYRPAMLRWRGALIHPPGAAGMMRTSAPTGTRSNNSTMS
jgi:hypothetical protein